MGVILNHILFPLLVFTFLVLMLVSAGLNAARVTWLYFIPDIGLWLAVSAILSLVEAGLKLRRILGKQMASESPA